MQDSCALASTKHIMKWPTMTKQCCQGAFFIIIIIRGFFLLLLSDNNVGTILASVKLHALLLTICHSRQSTLPSLHLIILLPTLNILNCDSSKSYVQTQSL